MPTDREDDLPPLNSCFYTVPRTAASVADHEPANHVVKYYIPWAHRLYRQLSVQAWCPLPAMD
jgi:hypothetical protein